MPTRRPRAPRRPAVAWISTRPPPLSYSSGVARKYRGGKGPPPALTPKEQELIADELASGRTYAQVAKDLADMGRPISESTLKKYMARRAKARRADEDDEPEPSELKLRRRRPPPDPDAPPPVLLDVGNTPAMLRRLLQNAQTNAEKAEREQNDAVAARYAKLAAEYANQLQRAEKAASVNRDVLQFQRSEIDEAMLRVMDRVRATLSRGQCRCPDCARDLSADLAGVPKPEAAQ